MFVFVVVLNAHRNKGWNCRAVQVAYSRKAVDVEDLQKVLR